MIMCCAFLSGANDSSFLIVYRLIQLTNIRWFSMFCLKSGHFLHKLQACPVKKVAMEMNEEDSRKRWLLRFSWLITFSSQSCGLCPCASPSPWQTRREYPKLLLASSRLPCSSQPNYRCMIIIWLHIYWIPKCANGSVVVLYGCCI